MSDCKLKIECAPGGFSWCCLPILMHRQNWYDHICCWQADWLC